MTCVPTSTPWGSSVCCLPGYVLQQGIAEEDVCNHWYVSKLIVFSVMMAIQVGLLLITLLYRMKIQNLENSREKKIQIRLVYGSFWQTILSSILDETILFIFGRHYILSKMILVLWYITSTISMYIICKQATLNALKSNDPSKPSSKDKDRKYTYLKSVMDAAFLLACVVGVTVLVFVYNTNANQYTFSVFFLVILSSGLFVMTYIHRMQTETNYEIENDKPVVMLLAFVQLSMILSLVFVMLQTSLRLPTGGLSTNYIELCFSIWRIVVLLCQVHLLSYF